MDGKLIRNKLIGNEEQRAVSPVIGVILMVAITVILAAVIAAFVLDLGGSVGEEAQAGVDMEVDEDEDQITISVTSEGNADNFRMGGDVKTDEIGEEADTERGDGEIGEDADVVQEDLAGAGDVVTLGDELLDGEEDSGTVTVVAVIDDDGTETTVASADYNFE